MEQMYEAGGRSMLSGQEDLSLIELVEGYSPSIDTVETFRESSFAVIAGVSGSGKDTMRRGLVRRDPALFTPVISTTTRDKRPKETNGVDYHFVDQETMQKNLNEHRLFQVASVHGNQISAMDINEIEAIKPDQTGLSILIVETEKDLRTRYKPDIRTLFLVPPSTRDWLERLHGYSRETSESDIENRISFAKNELDFALHEPGYFCLITDEISRTVPLADKFLKSGQKDIEEDSKARKLMQEIRSSLQ